MNAYADDRQTNNWIKFNWIEKGKKRKTIHPFSGSSRNRTTQEQNGEEKIEEFTVRTCI